MAKYLSERSYLRMWWYERFAHNENFRNLRINLRRILTFAKSRDSRLEAEA